MKEKTWSKYNERKTEEKKTERFFVNNRLSHRLLTIVPTS
jgi:hypothetical protein